ncbi:AraC family transcriptional regulator [Microbulbifer bruguierae]|uniref:AraC family transcriptional regulator n=1 Tax=Microbulbifer bruguierae TaxID=3029061 RepID=A0ABY8NFL4_9GAMM|nr:AraC family transcriptional regulator [Microbulbifer bruguierae]WGL17593.1 AraC family transcriptional regulator [Microbulbifer bruguierae]
MSTLIRATNLWGYDDLVRIRGGDPQPLLRRHRIAPAEFRDDESFLIFRDMAALLEDTAATLGYPEFGLKLAEFQGMDILGPISVIARSSSTVGTALESIARYLHLHCPALALNRTLEGAPHQRVIKFDYSINDDEIGTGVQTYELGLANAMQVMKLLCGEDFAPLGVFLMHAPMAGKQTYGEIFQCQVHFHQVWYGFYLPASVYSIPLSSVDHQTWQLAEHFLNSQKTPNASTITEDVVRLIRGLLPTGQCDSDAVAASLSMHKRTLQRRLAGEKTTFEQLLAEERQKLARDYLSETNLKLSQIAGLLGYSEQSALNRACRDWFGTTPRALRAHLLNQP